MLQINKNIIVIIGIVIIIFIGIISYIYFMKQSNPWSVIESKLKIKLPTSSEIIKYKDNSDEGRFDAKVSFDTQYIDFMKEQLNNYFKRTYEGSYPKEINFRNTCEWWDVDPDNIEASYNMVTCGEKNIFGRYGVYKK